MVQLVQPYVDPFTTLFPPLKCTGPNPEAVRLWSPTFEWAKNILQSPIWDSLTGTSAGNAFQFSLPLPCPVFDVPCCSNFELSSTPILEDPEKDDAPVATPQEPPRTPAKNKRTSKVQHLSEDELRRSQRIKKAHQGFKSDTSKKKDYVGCAADPPTISTRVIGELGKTFCNVDPEALTDQKLNAKGAKPGRKNKKGRKGKDGPSNSSDV